MNDEKMESVTIPRVSVIMPMEDDRGIAISSIRSWSSEQTYDRRHIDLVLVAAHADPAQDDAAKALLQPQDTFVYTEVENEFQLWDVGGHKAQGNILVFTEHHVLADPGCIAALVEFFRNTAYEAAVCRSVGISRTFLGHLEERLFHEIFNNNIENGTFWKTIALRGFAVKRELFLNEGGFQYRYAGFAERLFALSLHKDEHQLGYAKDAIINHYNTDSLLGLRFAQKTFAQGELAYRSRTPTADVAPYFGYIAHWAERASYRVQNARILANTIALNLLTNGQRSSRHTMTVQSATWFRYSIYGLLGAHWPLWKWRVAYVLSFCEVWLTWFDLERSYRAYCDHWQYLVYCAYFDFMVTYLSNNPPQWQETQQYQLYDIDDEQVVGFHLPESWNGYQFRWSSAASMVGVPLPPATYTVNLHLLPIEVAASANLTLYFNRQRIPEYKFDREANTVSFRIESAAFKPGTQTQFLVLLCETEPIKPPERRQLGLPIVAIEFCPIS